MTFEHVNIEIPTLNRLTIDGTRYYDTPSGEKLPSITSVISWIKRDFFKGWRERVGEDEANKITKAATSRGTDMHTLTENYLLNQELPEVQPLSQFLFKQAKPTLNRIDKIHAIEAPLYGLELGLAGTVDCIAEFDGELAIIDFKTSKKPKPREWIDDYFIQCAAYACMLFELTGIMVKKFVIIMSCEDGECVVYEERDKGKYIKLLQKYHREYLESKLQEYA